VGPVARLVFLLLFLATACDWSAGAKDALVPILLAIVAVWHLRSALRTKQFVTHDHTA
jgi:hypothetical protein